MAEHAAVNRRVVGSSPTRGAIFKVPSRIRMGLFYFKGYIKSHLQRRDPQSGFSVCKKHHPESFEELLVQDQSEIISCYHCTISIISIQFIQSHNTRYSIPRSQKQINPSYFHDFLKGKNISFFGYKKI
jgi:hypothetical protein